MNNKIKRITIEFENCDFVSLGPDNIISMFFERIADNILYMYGEARKIHMCDKCELTLRRKCLDNTCFNESTERVLSYFNNIVSIQLEYPLGIKTNIYMPWDDANDETNSYQKVEVTDDRITITIQKP